MRTLLATACLLLLIPAPAPAGNPAPAPALSAGPAPPPAKSPGSYPASEATDGREGGETIADAFVIPSLPFSDTGNTCNHLNDYDEGCPFLGSLSPDLVYTYTSPVDMLIDIDLCGSLYDTKVYVYENEYTPGVPFACNDDFYMPGDPCGDYVSKIEYLDILGGNTYYIVVDGYGGYCGQYNLEIYEVQPVEVPCPPGSLLEGEPPLVDDYDDQYNSGCGAVPEPVFQPIGGQGNGCAVMCAVSGWYLYDFLEYRDSDWFEVTATGQQIDWTLTPEYAVLMVVLPPDCYNPIFLASAEVDPGQTVTLSFATDPNTIYWLWVGPQAFTGPVNEFDYVMEVCGIVDHPVPIQRGSWGRVKALYR